MLGRARGIALSLIGFFLLVQAGMGQFFPSQYDARSIALSGSGSMLTGPYSAFSNPSGNAAIKHTTLTVGYHDYYQIAGLGSATFAAAVPLKSGCLGAAYLSSGYGSLRKNSASVSFAMKPGKKIRAGVGFNWHHVIQPAGYTRLYVIVPSAGIQFMPVKNLVAGLAVHNPAGQQFRPHGYLKLPTVITAGLGYQMGKEVLICFETAASGNQVVYSGGAEFSPAQMLSLRLGLSKRDCTCYSAGMGLHFNHFSWDIAVNHHPVLGFSPALDLSYSLQ